MGRGTRRTAAAWSVCLLVALACDGLAGTSANPLLGTSLLAVAAGGTGILLLVLLFGALAGVRSRWLRGRQGRGRGRAVRAARRSSLMNRIDASADVPVPSRGAASSVVDDGVAALAATRVRFLEAQLAMEEERLTAAADALAATDSLATARADAVQRGMEVDPSAAEAEPVLRRQLLEAVAQFADGPLTPDVVGDVAELLARTG